MNTRSAAAKRCKDGTTTRPATAGSWKKGSGGGLALLTPEQREAVVLRAQAKARAIPDIAEELKRAASLATDTIVALTIDPAVSPETKLAAANSILNRVYGMPVARVQGNVDVNLREHRVVTAEDVRAAALKLAAQTAIDVEPA